MKGLAEALRKPAVGVSNLEALASCGNGPLRAAVLDARRGDVYGAVYDAAGGIVVPEMVAKLPVWLAALPPGVEFVSNDFAAFGDRLPEGPRVTAPRELAAVVARIAATREPQDPAAARCQLRQKVRRGDGLEGPRPLVARPRLLRHLDEEVRELFARVDLQLDAAFSPES